MRQYEKGEELLLVVSGSLEVVDEDGDNAPLVLAEKERGDIVGELSVLTGEKRTAAIYVKNKAELLVLSRQSLAQLRAEMPDTYELFAAALQRRAEKTRMQYVLRATGLFDALDEVELADLAPDSQLEVASVPVGQQAPGVFPSLPLANAVHPIGSQAAMVIANPADDQVYFYPEGATSTSGSFQGHGLFPRAVTIIDRSLREDAPGVYTGRLRVPQEGEYLVALMLGDPLLVHCFEFTAKPNAALEQAAANLPEVAYLIEEMMPVVGQPFTFQLKLVDPASGAGVEGVQDVFVLASQAAGNWNSRAVAAELGDSVYEVQLTLPQAGLYTVFIAAPSLGLNAGQLPTLNLRVTAGG